VAAAGCGYLLVAAAADAGQFPRGFDAVEAAPARHRVVFENSLVRVLEVSIPAAGKSEPMHSLETVEQNTDSKPLRVEIKVSR
jgi:hypothetical protein